MSQAREKSLFLFHAVLLLAIGGVARAQNGGVGTRPKEFGTQDYTVTVMSAAAFTTSDTNMFTDPAGNRYFLNGFNGILYSKVGIPSGAVIDYVGVHRYCANGGDALSTDLFYVDEHSGTTSGIVHVQSAGTGGHTDYNPTPLGWQLTQNARNALAVTVYLSGGSWLEWIEIWWKRAASPPPTQPSFEDVPTTHRFFSYIEALKASGITGGCWLFPPRFCPDDPLTRGQMAVFLTKALGLHWTNSPVAALPARAPAEFGVQDYTVTTIPATSFTSASTDLLPSYITDYGSLARYFPIDGGGGTYWAGVNLPSGAVIDYIGLEAASTGYGELTANLFQKNISTLTPIASVANTPHGFDTDYNSAPVGFQVENVDHALVLNVQQLANTEPLFGWVEIWWHRAVSPPPASASFNDVPTSHPFFQYVEALKASGITGGCQVNPPLYCPDNSLTRGQMAVFLAKALGLHWPN